MRFAIRSLSRLSRSYNALDGVRSTSAQQCIPSIVYGDILEMRLPDAPYDTYGICCDSRVVV
ncbi:unnamed protein product [Periconia digitata]|uniref:Uncharacterized protein n=1 Tax=Periconia digitata TaxID=1303443 RepID=A0A9W4U5X5_9PLEO|nr:unnamed protein product [Periconia digitata]